MDTALNAADALKKLKTSTFDAVLIDYHMPGGNGYAVFLHQRAKRAFRPPQRVKTNWLGHDAVWL